MFGLNFSARVRQANRKARRRATALNVEACDPRVLLSTIPAIVPASVTPATQTVSQTCKKTPPPPAVQILTINGHTYKIAPKANLQGADLHGAKLANANLAGANLKQKDMHCVLDLRLPVG